ncbi:MAG TPA: Gfo/Idh/MocA family oxidoreductase [Anaerovoracaceae bacterium]|nr:Gfo/Idh/MocA family oxidoreductase [Anaerovoracaceae bacterium]
MKRLKTGIIGTGFIGPAHIEALRRTGLADVAALADVSDEVTKAKADELSIPKYYGDYKKLLADPDLDIVHICTPNHLHFRMAKEALEAGKHVVCEKPLAMNAGEADGLVRLAEEKGLVNAVHFNLRFYPMVHHVRAMIQNGELGEIFAVNGSYQQDWLFYETDYNWRLEPAYSGESRAVADIGSHWMDSVEFMTGLNVEKVCADFATFHPIRKKPLRPLETYSGKPLAPEDYSDIEISTEDYATVLLKFNGKAHGSLTVNQVAAGRKNRCYYEIYGSKKSAVIDTERPNELWIGRRDAGNELLLKDPSLLLEPARAITSFPGGHNEGFPDTSKQLFKKLYAYIQNGCKGEIEFPTFAAGARELKLCEVIVDSARSESWKQV